MKLFCCTEVPAGQSRVGRTHARAGTDLGFTDGISLFQASLLKLLSSWPASHCPMACWGCGLKSSCATSLVSPDLPGLCLYWYSPDLGFQFFPQNLHSLPQMHQLLSPLQLHYLSTHTYKMKSTYQHLLGCPREVLQCPATMAWVRIAMAAPALNSPADRKSVV